MSIKRKAILIALAVPAALSGIALANAWWDGSLGLVRPYFLVANLGVVFVGVASIAAVLCTRGWRGAP